jgi:transposase
MRNIPKKQIDDAIRQQICTKYGDGKSIAVISKEVGIPYRAVANIIRIFKMRGRILALKHRVSRPSKLTNTIKTFIDDLISQDVSTTLQTMKNKILESFGASVGRSTIQRHLQAFNYSIKRLILVPIARNSIRNVNTRFDYAQNFVVWDENKLIYIDEMGISCSSRRMYGRSLIGTSPLKTIAAIRSKNFSTCAAMHKSGLLYFKTYDTPYNTEKYGSFLGDLFLKLEERGLKNCILIMDNCPIHKAGILRESIEAAGHIMTFLPPYSPQLNPIEEGFSQWKNHIKSLNCMTVEELNNAIFRSAFNVTEQDCNKYYEHVRLFILKALRREEF